MKKRSKSSSQRRHRVHPKNSLPFESLESRQLLASIQVIAAGVTNAEQLELRIDETTVQTWNNIGGDAYAGDFTTLSFSNGQSVSPNQIQVAFTNDLYEPENGIDRNVRIDAIVIDGVRYESEAPTVFSTGTWTPANGITPGNWNSEYLHGDGYFQYFDSANSGSEIAVTARGSIGEENFDLQIDGQTVAQFSVGTVNESFVYRASDSISADQIRVVFTNDRYEPANNIDANLTIDHISIDGTNFQTEAPNVYSTGTWLASDGIQPGFRESDTLHTNGYFQYGTTVPGSIGLTLDSLAIDEDLGELTFVIFRSDGSDETVTVDYATSFGTADAADFQIVSGTLSFGPGITAHQVSVQITDDTDIESAETFSMTVSNPTGGATLSAITQQLVTINDNDEFTGIVFDDSFEAGTNWTTNPSGTDSATTGQWAIGSPQPTSSNGISLQLNAGHTGSRALVTGLAAGSTAGAFDVDSGITRVVSPTIDIPNAAEIELSFYYYFSYLDNASNDDFFETSIISGGAETEVYADHAHNSNQSAAWQHVQIDLSSFAGQSIQIAFDAADMLGNSLIEAAVDDVVVEVLPNLPGTISVATTGVNLEESAGTASVIIQRNVGRSGIVTVDYATESGTATTADYTHVSGTITFADGQSSATINIPINDDAIVENLESFRLQLSNPTGGALLGTNDFGTITIADNDNTVRDFLPDLTPIESTLSEALRLDTTEQPGRQLMRFSTEVANAGTGPLEIWGGSVSGSSQQVFQRVYQEGGSSRDRLAGEFVYHAGHGHIHFEGFATYNLRLLNESGDIVASGGKTSFCLINIRHPFPDVTANAEKVHGRGGSSCGQVQGLSAGYSDVYSANLDDQWIDITDVSDGSYWLEIETDPENNILESDETNNKARIQIRISNGQPSAASEPAPNAPVVANPEFSATGSGVIIAVIDTGIDWTHPKLANGQWINRGEIAGDGIDNDGNGYVDDVYGYDFFDNDSTPIDDNGHGTFTAGMLVSHPAGDRTHGIAPDAKLMTIRAMGSDGVGNFQAVADGIIYAVDNGANIISLPLESGFNQQIFSALEYANQNDVLIVAATGNQSNTTPSYIASQSALFNNVIAAGAIDHDGSPLPESNRVGESNAIQIDASGIAFSTLPDNRYGTYRGSSVSATQITGAAALALAQNPSLTAAQIRDILIESSSPITSDSDSLGALDIQSAIDLAEQSNQISTRLNGSHLIVTATSSDDFIQYSAGQASILINGIAYEIPEGPVSRIIVFGGEGADRILLTGTSGNDQGLIQDDFARLSTPSVVVVGRGFDYVQLIGGAGHDVVEIQDTSGNDHVEIMSDRASLASTSIYRDGIEFEEVRITATTGFDTAHLFGSDATDRFFGTPHISRLNGAEVFAQIGRFDSVSVDLGESFDPVILRGGAESETLVVTPSTADFSGQNFETLISNLERTTSNAGPGSDTLHILDGPGRDVINSRPQNSLLVGDQYDHRAYGYERTTIESSGGTDRATLVGSTESDTFSGGPSESTFAGTSFETKLRGFPTILVKGHGGNDQSVLTGTDRNDAFYFSPALANVRNTEFQITTIGFSNSRFSGGGGFDQAVVFDGTGDDRLRLYQTRVELLNDNYFASFDSIDDVRAKSALDSGSDTIERMDSELDFAFADYGDWQHI